jgi:DNA-binding SARP family transcriptional activator
LEDDCRARLLWYRARLKEPRRGALLKQQWFELVEWRLKQLEHGVAVRLGRDALARGDGRAAAEFAAQLVAAGALDEDATEIYMRALISLGRRQAALAYYDQYVEALSREFGVGPSEGLRRFAASLAS